MQAIAHNPTDAFAGPLWRRRGICPDVSTARRAVRTIAAATLRGWLYGYHRLTIEGREHLPREGPFVLISNHCSHLDALCLAAAMPLRRVHRTYAAAAADYFFSNLPRMLFSVLAANALPFNRNLRSKQCLDACRRLLQADPPSALILFPEGTRSPTGQLGAFKAGIAMLVAGTSIPVVPCHLSGTFAAMPKGSWFPRPRTLRMRIGPPRSYAASGNDRDSLEAIARELRAAVMELAAREEPVKQNAAPTDYASLPATAASVPG